MFVRGPAVKAEQRDGDADKRLVADAAHRWAHSAEITWLAHAIDRGDMSGAARLRKLCRPENNGLADPRALAVWCVWASQRNRLSAYEILGYEYLRGRAFKKDGPTGIKYLELAAKERNSTLRWRVAATYLKGLDGVPASPKRAVYWLERSLEAGNDIAGLVLADIYYHGQFGVRDRVKALKWSHVGTAREKKLSDVDKSYAEGMTEAQIEKAIGQAMDFEARQGPTVTEGCWPKRDVAARSIPPLYRFLWYRADRELYRKSVVMFRDLSGKAKNGDPDAQFRVGLVYSLGAKDIPRNCEKALLWLRRAAKAGHKQAPYWLGRIYYEGIIVVRDTVTASQWFLRAAQRGDRDGEYGMARLQQDGFWPDSDSVKRAYATMLRLAEAGNVRAQFWLAQMYYLGDEGAGRDDSRALRWAVASAEDGSQFGVRLVAQIYADQKNRKFDASKGLEWLTIYDAISDFPTYLDDLKAAVATKLSVADRNTARRNAEAWIAMHWTKH
jgi:TPR repeat protein